MGICAKAYQRRFRLRSDERLLYSFFQRAVRDDDIDSVAKADGAYRFVGNRSAIQRILSSPAFPRDADGEDAWMEECCRPVAATAHTEGAPAHSALQVALASAICVSCAYPGRVTAESIVTVHGYLASLVWAGKVLGGECGFPIRAFLHSAMLAMDSEGFDDGEPIFCALGAMLLGASIDSHMVECLVSWEEEMAAERGSCAGDGWLSRLTDYRGGLGLWKRLILDMESSVIVQPIIDRVRDWR